MFLKNYSDYTIKKTKYLLFIILIFSFSIKVFSNNSVTLTCPENVTLDLNACETDTTYFYDDLVWSSSVPLVDTTFNPPSGSVFLENSTTTVSLAVLDENGDLSTCSFEISVGTGSLSQVVCNDNVQVSLPNGDCQNEVLPEMLLYGNLDYCYEDIEVEILNAIGQPIPTSPFLTLADVGIEYIGRVRHLPTGNMCWGSVITHYKLDPVISCNDTTIYCHQPDEPFFTGMPEVLESCYPENQLNFSFTNSISQGGCDSLFTFKINRFWTVSDPLGNQSTCNQEITLAMFDFADIDFPPNYDNVELSALNCSEDVPIEMLADTSITGQPTVDGFLVENPQCEMSFLYSDSVTQICGNSWEIKREWTAINWCVNDFFYHTQVILIEDFNAPEFQLPDTIFTSLSMNCDSEIELAPAEVLSECSDYFGQISTPFGNIESDGGISDFSVDIGNFEIIYTLTDSCGNSSSQTSIWQISQDEFLTCPENVTIDCDNYFDNYENGLNNGNYAILQDFGSMDFYDNCDFEVQDSADISVDSCGIGVIVHYLNTPNLANPHQCIQNIFVEHKSDFVVVFPDDQFAVCENDPLDFGEPIISGESCENLIIDFEDEVFTTVPDACYKIVRTWMIINSCIAGANPSQIIDEPTECEANLDFNGNGIDCSTDNSQGNGIYVGEGHRTFREDLANPDGYITYQQVIKVNDITAPVFLDFDIPHFCNDLDSLMLPMPEVLDCGEYVVSVESTTLPGGANSFGPYFNVPNGNYTVVYKASDNCGNFSICETDFELTDDESPNAECKSSNTLEVLNTTPPAVDIWVDDLDNGSFDNCNVGVSNLTLSFSPTEQMSQWVFGCNDICNGETELEMWVTDEDGNQDNCTTTIILQDPWGLCECSYALVQGEIYTPEFETTALVKVQAQCNQYSENIITDGSGYYEFFLPEWDNCEIVPEKDVFPQNGVTTFDIVLIVQHVLGMMPFENPYQYIAADINNSGTVTTFDAVNLRMFILGCDPNFTNNSSWRFVDASFEFPNPENPWQTPFPESIEINYDMLDADFVAVKIGDLNSSAFVLDLMGVDDRNLDQQSFFQIDNQPFTNGEIIKIPFYINQNKLAGCQFALHFDPEILAFENIEFGLAKNENFGFDFTEKGLILVSWNQNFSTQNTAGNLLFNLKMSAQTSGVLSENLSIQNDPIINEGFDSEGNFYEMILDWNHSNSIQLSTAKPNPFSEETLFDLQLEKAETIKIQMTDVSGKIILDKEQFFEKGAQKIVFNKNDFPNIGLYFLTIEIGKKQFFRKLIFTQ